jgi:UDPglucose--hexose-1-phosphate uridylyltransferase
MPDEPTLGLSTLPNDDPQQQETTVTAAIRRSASSPVTKTVVRMADGRELIYFDETDHPDRVLVDPRDLPQVISGSQVRYDALLGEWVCIAGHRQTRIYHPPANACPPVPVHSDEPERDPFSGLRCRGFRKPVPAFAGGGGQALEGDLFDSRPGYGRYEVEWFTADHDALLSALPQSRMRTVIEAWADRTAVLQQLDGVEQVVCFENRGVGIGVTLAHPHGQIYGYPLVTPKTAAAIRSGQQDRHGPAATCSVTFWPARSAVGIGSSRARTGCATHSAVTPRPVDPHPVARIAEVRALPASLKIPDPAERSPERAPCTGKEPLP